MSEKPYDREILPKAQARAHSIAIDHGFWDGPEQDNVPTKIALIHEEVSEALKDFREGHMELHYKYTAPSDLGVNTVQDPDGSGWLVVPSQGLRYPRTHENFLRLGFKAKPEGFPIELADVMIRVMDLAERKGIDLAAMIDLKMTYNEGREHMHGRRV